jgi:hypothetical protein
MRALAAARRSIASASAALAGESGSVGTLAEIGPHRI